MLNSLPSFLKKQYKYFPNTHKNAEENDSALPKHVPPATDPSIAPPTTVVPQIPSSYVLLTVNPNVCINSFSCPTDKFVTEILNLFRPHVAPSPNIDPFVILNYVFDTYRNLQNLLQLHNIVYQCLTLSTIHVNDFLKELVLLQTPTLPTSS